MRANRLSLFALLLLCTACAVAKAEPIQRIALLGPFEGRYREVGYDALYAARLATQDAGDLQLELFPVDDGGSTQSAASRAEALSLDPLVKAVIALGYAATSSDAQQAYGDLPVLVVGSWDAEPQTENIFILASADLRSRLTAPEHIDVTDAARLDAPIVGGDVFALAQFPKLRDTLDGVTVVSSGQLPDVTFTTRYRGSDQFAPQPGLLATLAYDAVRMAAQSILDTSGSRSDVRQSIASNGGRPGLSGVIAFENGYWKDAPVHTFIYQDGALVQQPG
jgi:ABC-type branched-subunit amino acid transport system substrate-binding protein